MSDETTKAPCNSCGRETKHVVLQTRTTSDFEVIAECGEVSWEDTFEMLECRGCESVKLRHTHSFSEIDGLEVRYYPPPLARKSPTWAHKAKHPIPLLLEEVYSALHAGSRFLAVAGARTILDAVLLDKVGDIGSFEARLEELEKQGFVGKKNREFLVIALEAGNAAAHRGYRAKEDEVQHVMDIVENLLQAVYALDKAAESLKRSVPPRQRRKP